MALPYDPNLPLKFVVKHTTDGRNGYVFFKGVLSPQQENAQRFVRLQPDRHTNRYFNIHRGNPITTWTRCNIVKGSGSVQREINWKHTEERLHNNNQTWPVLEVEHFDRFPAWHQGQHFIPITTPLPPIQPQAPAQPQAPIVQRLEIPSHAVRALLTYAVIQDESCPILDIPITLETGAVTSCFHVFEKGAIKQWLETQLSEEKCPICKQKCTVFSLE